MSKGGTHETVETRGTGQVTVSSMKHTSMRARVLNIKGAAEVAAVVDAEWNASSRHT